jgi:hypothetical protein
MKKEVKPGDLIKSFAIPKAAAICQKLKGEANNYGWYENNGVWYPHRLPTVQEVMQDKFK